MDNKSNAVIALTGAGISKAAGIPTFQEFPGITEKLSVNYKKAHPQEFNETMDTLKANCSGKSPTQAHLILAKYKVPIITMNIDGLHKAAGSDYVLEIHGNVYEDNVVLYGQQIHYAEKSVNLIYKFGKFCKANDINGKLLIIGTSMQTQFANYLVTIADQVDLSIQFINENAEEEVPKSLINVNLKWQEYFLDDISFD